MGGGRGVQFLKWGMTEKVWEPLGYKIKFDLTLAYRYSYS